MHLPPERFAGHVAYSTAKYGMSIFVIGMAEEFRPDGIAVNALWPKSGTGIVYFYTVVSFLAYFAILECYYLFNNASIWQLSELLQRK